MIEPIMELRKKSGVLPRSCGANLRIRNHQYMGCRSGRLEAWVNDAPQKNVEDTYRVKSPVWPSTEQERPLIDCDFTPEHREKPERTQPGKQGDICAQEG